MPKRSAGCFACRARKVRCDETKPECNICIRRGTKCPGYRPAQAFLLHSFDTRRKPAIIQDEANNKPDTEPTVDTEIVRASKSDHTVPILKSDSTLPQQISIIPTNRLQHISTFVSLYLPLEQSKPLTPPSEVVWSLPRVPTTHQVLPAAMDALCAAQLAVAHKNDVLVNRSRGLYGVALTLLMRAITNGDQPAEDETILAAYLLSLYEVFVGVSAGVGFFFHVNGVLRLLQQRGPDSVARSPTAMSLYHATRYFAATLGLASRTGSVLDSPSWLGITANLPLSLPNSWISLMDLAIKIPRILERHDKLKKSSTALSDYITLLEDAKALIAESTEWIKKFEKDGRRYRRVNLNEIEGYDASEFHSPFRNHTTEGKAKEHETKVNRFENHGAANCYLVYWMAMIILQTTISQLTQYVTTQYSQQQARRKDQSPFTDSQEENQAARSDLDFSTFFSSLLSPDPRAAIPNLVKYAINVCLSIPFCTRPQAGFVGRFSILMPLAVAQKLFTAMGKEEEATWCGKMWKKTSVPGLYNASVGEGVNERYINP